MLFRLRRDAAKAFYRWRCAKIDETAPLKPTSANLVFVSMVSHADLLMYLVAIKSIYNWIGCGQIVVLNDSSLTDADKARLEQHLGDPAIIDIATVDTGGCPRGGCWERLLAIVDQSANAYVVQVDSDLLAVADLPEILEAVRQNRSFVLSTKMGRQVIALSAAEEAVRSSQSAHVQILAEQNFPRLGYEGRRYIRGCAGFSGFARGSLSRSTLETFSRDMQSLIGDKWLEWGSEQVASNYLVANDSEPIVLPYPKYANYDPGLGGDGTHLYHFIGDHRFTGGRYIELSRRVIAGLLK